MRSSLVCTSAPFEHKVASLSDTDTILQDMPRQDRVGKTIWTSAGPDFASLRPHPESLVNQVFPGEAQTKRIFRQEKGT